MTYKNSKWHAKRWSKNEEKNFSNGSYDNKETAAHASDTLARKLIANGEKGHKLNFPDDTGVSTEKETVTEDSFVRDIEVYISEYQKEKRKRHDNLENSQDSKSHQIPKK